MRLRTPDTAAQGRADICGVRAAINSNSPAFSPYARSNQSGADSGPARDNVQRILRCHRLQDWRAESWSDSFHTAHPVTRLSRRRKSTESQIPLRSWPTQRFEPGADFFLKKRMPEH